MKSILKNVIFLACTLLALGHGVSAQTISGTVNERVNGRSIPLPGVNIYWLGTTQGTTTDSVGRYAIAPAPPADRLVFSFVGYLSDTITVGTRTTLDVTLRGGATLGEVTVSGASTVIDRLSPIQTEILTTRTLAKAACCNLSETFETNASVNVTFSDAVTGSKQIQMLGLSGNYIQLTAENVPGIRGLASTFGLNYIPGTWISSIDVGKGVGSVTTGYEAMTGAINVELQKPDARERVYVNGYANSFGRVEANLNLSRPLNKRWSVGLLSHASTFQNELDQNGDRFMDLPKYNQYNGILRAKYSGERFMAQFGVKALTEDRLGGQLSSVPGQRYSFTNDTRRLEFFSKTARLYPDQPYKGLGLIVNAVDHEQSSMFGLIPYDGRQRTLYGNLIYQTILGNTNHTVKTGLSYLYDEYRERYRGSPFNRTESVPGVFGEYTYTYPERFSLVLGNRLDFHNLFGTQWTPRVHFKYHIHGRLTARASAGRGFRVPNALAENYGLLVSSRAVQFLNPVQPEISWNYGTSLTYEFPLLGQPATLVFDYYRTTFQNQLVVDLEHPTHVYFYNLRGQSFSNSFQAELNAQPVKRLEMKLAYRFFDVRQAMGVPTGERVVLPRMMVSRDRVLFNIGYALPYDKWKADFTLQWNGPRRIPVLTAPSLLEFNYRNMPTEQAPAFANLNAQVSRAFRTFEIYLGGENLSNFRQQDPITNPGNPFGPRFDAAARNWGPITGRMIYAGFRYKVKR